MYANSISAINIMFNFMFKVFLVNKKQLSKAIGQFSFKNVLKFFPFVSIYVFIHSGNSGTQFFL